MHNERKSRNYEQRSSWCECKNVNLKPLERTCKSEWQLESLREGFKSEEENNVYLKSQLEFYESEIRKINEKVTEERKEWIVIVEKLKEELKMQKSKDLVKKKEKLDSNFLMKREILLLENRETELLREILIVKQQFDEEKMELIRIMMQKDVENIKLRREIREVWEENNELNKICEKLKFDLTILSRETANLHENCKNFEKLHQKIENFKRSKVFSSSDEKSVHKIYKKAKKSVETAQDKLRLFKKCLNPNFSSGDALKLTHIKKESAETNKNIEGSIKNKVKTLKTELSEVNNNYKKLLTSSKPGSSAHLKYKKEIESAGKMLEDKSRYLFKSKRRYSSLIRQRSVSADFN